MVSDAALIETRDLAFAYGTVPVLDGVSFQARAGEFVALVGPNGSGKSTLLKLLLGLLPPSRGETKLAGVPLSELNRRTIARKAALVPQETDAGFSFSVREVVGMGRTPYLGRFRPESDEDLKAIAWALAQTETEALAERPFSELSGGERQRVMIARAVAQQTPVLLLDEPTANLDVEHQLETLQLVRGLAKEGRCAVAAIHDLSLAARFCDRLLFLAGGRIVADGPPEQVVTAENLQKYFRIQAKILRDEEIGALTVLPIAPLAQEKKPQGG